MNETTPNPTTEADLQHIKKRSITGAISFFIRTLLVQAIGLVSVLILSAYLTPADFGIYGLVIQIISILVFFSDIGLAASLVQKKTEPTLTEYRTAFTIQQLLSWFIVLVCVLIAATGFIQAKAGSAGMWILLSLAISFPIVSLKTISAIMLERNLEFSKVVLPQIIEQLVFHGILIVMAYQGVGAMAYAYAAFARAVLGTAVMWWLQPWSIGFSLDRSALKHLVGYGAKFQLNDLLARVKDQLYFLVLGIWLPLTTFGYIHWSKNWSLYPYNLTVQNILAITFPTFSRLQENPAALKKAIEKSLYFIALAVFPLLMWMVVLIEPLVVLVPKYHQWQPALLSFILFTLSTGGGAILTLMTNVLNAIGRINDTLKLMVGWITLTWVVTPLLMLRMGFDGVAATTLLVSLTAVVPVWLVKQSVPIKVWPEIWRQLVAVLVMGLVGWWGQSLWQQSWWHFVAGGLVTGAAYLGALLLLGPRKLLSELALLRSAYRP